LKRLMIRRGLMTRICKLAILIILQLLLSSAFGAEESLKYDISMQVSYDLDLSARRSIGHEAHCDAIHILLIC